MKIIQKVLLVALALTMGSQALLARSELSSAVVDDRPELVATLIESGVPVNRVERDGSSPLLWAVYHEHVDIARQLIEAGADVEQSNREGMTPLILATTTGNSELVRLLLDAGAGVNNTLPNGETALMMASRTGDRETVQLLLDRGADIDATENLRDTTALMWASAYRQPGVVSLLVENGASPHSTSSATDPGRDPYLAPSARERIREFFEGSGLVGDSLGADSDEELREQREELLARLPEELKRDFQREMEGRDSNAIRSQEGSQWGGLAPLHFAVREGDLQTVKTLVEAGADVNQLSEYGWSPLLTATQNRYYEIGAFLLEQGANPNIRNEGGWSPLYIATDNRNIEGGDYPTRKPDMPHLDYIKLLLDHGADPNLRMQSSTETRTIFTHQWLNEDGATPFLRAAQSSDLELMELLLEHGADPNINTRDGVTPLMVASGIAWVEGITYEWSEEANAEAIRWLIELGNDVNAQDAEDKRTALMGAAFKGRNYAVEILVENGADLSLRDIGSRDSIHKLSGATWQAIDYAEGLVRIGVQSAEEHPETAALIRELMKERGLEVPPEGRTLDSICITDVCK